MVFVLFSHINIIYVPVWGEMTEMPRAWKTWPRGRDLWRLGRTTEMSRPRVFGRRPNPISINAQTEISEANPSLRIR